MAALTMGVPLPTVEYAICQGYKDYMPLGARCIHVTNSGPQRQNMINLCKSTGPRQEYFVTLKLETMLHVVTKKAGLPSEVTQHIATFLVPLANQYHLSLYYRTENHLQLEQNAYACGERSVFKSMTSLLDSYYQT